VVRKLAGQLVEAIVVDLKFEFLVETVQPFRSDKVVNRCSPLTGLSVI
jgi:hypothetical protein